MFMTVDNHAEPDTEPDTFGDLAQYFEDPEETGEEVSEQMATITNKALRGRRDKKDSDKLQELQDKYKRPKNVQNLQVPKINDVIWRQLRRENRIHDFSLQQSHKNYALSLIPILRALEALTRAVSRTARSTILSA
jgi:hypothetical protein